MLKKLILVLILALNVGILFAQTDTIYINSKMVLGAVKEVTEDAVKFSYPGEDLINTVYKNSIQKIVFKNGRIQTFTEASSFKEVKAVEDYNNVSTTVVENEVKGLFKIGDVSSKAKGTTTLSNQERVKQRAYKKLKIEAAMMGANIVYLTNQRTEGNKLGGYFQASSSAETNLTGVAYATLVPDYTEFMKIVGSKSNFTSDFRYKLWASDSDYSKESYIKQFYITKVTNENGTITISADLEGEGKYKVFKVANFNDAGFNVFYEDKSTIYNIHFSF